MQCNIRNWIVGLAFGVLLCACHGTGMHHRSSMGGKSLPEVCYSAVDSLLRQHPHITDTDRIIVTTPVDLNGVSRTSMFGRQAMECLASRLTQKNRDVVHLTVREGAIVINQAGQFLLSRDVQDLAWDWNARSVLVGTYGVTEGNIYLSLKLVSTVDNATLAAVDKVIPLDEELRFMVAERKQAGYPYPWTPPMR